MRLTTVQLRQIIREEVQNVTRRRRRLREMAHIGGMDSALAASCSIDAGKMYYAAFEAFGNTKLWSAIEMLLEQVLEGFEDANPKAAIRGLDGLWMKLDEMGETQFADKYVRPLQRKMGMSVDY